MSALHTINSNSNSPNDSVRSNSKANNSAVTQSNNNIKNAMSFSPLTLNNSNNNNNNSSTGL